MHKQISKIKFIFSLIIITFFSLIIIGYLGTVEAYPMPDPPKHIEAVYKTDTLVHKTDTVKGVIREVSAYSELDSCHTGKSCLMANGEKAKE